MAQKKMEMNVVDLRALIDFEHDSPCLSRQCELLGLPRSSYYYEPMPVSDEDIKLASALDRLYLEKPFYGSRRMADSLQKNGWSVGRKRVANMMKEIGLEAIYPKPRLSSPGVCGNVKYPYLLRELIICKPNHVWCSDITYIPMPRGHMYLVAVMDWFSRYVLAWRLSNTLCYDFCVDTYNAALKYGHPEIHNTDQGSQFTSQNFIECVEASGAKVSWDGRGRALDNAFIERLWRSVKYEKVYLAAYADGRELNKGLEDYFHFYNHERGHQGLDYATPAELYLRGPQKIE